MLGERLIIVSDAHLGAGAGAVEEAFEAFLERVPTLGDSLLLNGDLFDFWFSYERVVPRDGFRVAAALAHLSRRLPIVMVGGNHDRWGGNFWQEQVRLRFEPLRAEFTIGRRRALALHGDGVTEGRWSADWLHRITRHPATIATFRALHPDLGFWLADRLSHRLRYGEQHAAALELAAHRQRTWAEQQLAEAPDLGLVIMGHTHLPALAEPAPGQQYLNPGAWVDGFRYAVATEQGAELLSYTSTQNG